MNTLRRRTTLPFAAALIAVSAVGAVATGASSAEDAPLRLPTGYGSNLALIRAQTVRNTNHDSSAFREVAQDDLVPEDHYGPRSDYLDDTLNPPESHFPDSSGGQFRIACEFSHFAYDDPIVRPGEPGAAHLHMFWGNTDANAMSTYDTLIDSGSSTCNGQELNRSGYWAPAVFDADGDVRIPDRIIVYYKGYGEALDRAQLYPPEAAMVATNLHEVSADRGGVQGVGDEQFSFLCSNQYRGPRSPASNTMPTCIGRDDNPFTNKDPETRLEMHVKFPNCWNGQDPSDPDNWVLAAYGSWFSSHCEGPDGTDWPAVPNIEYIIQYPLTGDETTEGWYLSSDVDPVSYDVRSDRGASAHADWWGGWHRPTNQLWLDNCATFDLGSEPTGCGFGYLSNGGTNPANPLPGPALKFRPDYTGPIEVPASTLFDELCNTDRRFAGPSSAAYCTPFGAAGPPPFDPRDLEPIDSGATATATAERRSG